MRKSIPVILLTILFLIAMPGAHAHACSVGISPGERGEVTRWIHVGSAGVEEHVYPNLKSDYTVVFLDPVSLFSNGMCGPTTFYLRKDVAMPAFAIAALLVVSIGYYVFRRLRRKVV